MKANSLITRVVVILLMFALSAAAGQQPNSGKSRPPQLTTEDLKESSSSSLSKSPVSKSIAPDSGKWQRYAPQELALSIELPGKPLLMGISLPDAGGLGLSPGKAYTYQSEQITVLVLRFSKKSQMNPSDLRDFAAGFLDASAKRPGVSDVESQVKLRDDSTVLLQGTYKEGSVVFETRGFVHTSGSDLWLIVTRFAQADEPASEVSLRVINSVKIQ